MRFVMHSYTFRAYPLAEAFRNAIRFGWDGIELQPCHFNPAEVGTELARVSAEAREAGVAIECLDFGGDFIGADTAIREAAVSQAERAIDACAENGVGLLNGMLGGLVVDPEDWSKNGSAAAEDAHYERAAEAMRHLGGRAAAKGIRIVLEIHMNTIHDSVASTVRLLDLIGLDNVQANPDCGNMFAVAHAEKDPAALDQLAGRIGYCHFKNCASRGGEWDYSVRLEEGHVDVYKWLEKLHALGFDESVCIEFCGHGDPHVAARADLAYARDCWAWIRGKA